MSSLFKWKNSTWNLRLDYQRIQFYIIKALFLLGWVHARECVNYWNRVQFKYPRQCIFVLKKCRTLCIIIGCTKNLSSQFKWKTSNWNLRLDYQRIQFYMIKALFLLGWVHARECVNYWNKVQFKYLRQCIFVLKKCRTPSIIIWRTKNVSSHFKWKKSTWNQRPDLQKNSFYIIKALFLLGWVHVKEHVNYFSLKNCKTFCNIIWCTKHWLSCFK